MKVKATYNQALIDISLAGAGDVDLLIDTARLNALSITDDIVAGTVYSTPDAAIDKAKIAAFFIQKQYNPCSNGDDAAITGATSFVVITPALSKGLLRIKEGQTIIDMALQGSGDVNRFIEVAKLNGLSITDNINAGDLINTPDALLNKRSFAKFFNSVPNFPASGDTELAQQDELHGVGYDIIEDDQIVYP